MPLIGAPQGHCNWWTKGLVWAQKGTEEQGWRLGNCEECSPDLAPILTKPQDGRKAKLNSPQPAVARKTNRTHLAGLKSAGG